MKNKTFYITLLYIFFSHLVSFGKELRWNWSTIDTTKIWFPTHFMWGCADSALQTEGLMTSNNQTIQNSWTQLEEEENRLVRVGIACNRWELFKQDYQRAQSLGMKAHRLSIDWSKIEPTENCFDLEALDHYQEAVEYLCKLDIEPFITLFHHVAPIWFMDKGGFEKEENIYYFVRFALKVFERLHTKTRYWIIFNEPVAYAFEGYFRGRYPPKKESLLLAGTVVSNQLNAHVAIAKRFKQASSKTQIGIAHMSHPIDGYSRWNFLEKSITKLFSALMNESTIQFFKNGKFKWLYPWALYTNADAPTSLDFFGVNYYTHTTIRQIKWNKMVACHKPEEVIIDDCGDPERCKVMYPEGLYRSIKRASKLGLPIFITENGVASSDPKIKDDYLRKHLYVISKCLQEGYDIRGYFFWTLTDCFSWNKGFENKHGIYSVDFATQQRTYNPSCDYLINTIKRFSLSPIPRDEAI